MQIIFKSTIRGSLMMHIIECFGHSAARTCELQSFDWGDILTITRGQHKGVYDIHYNTNDASVKFIRA